MSTYSLYIIECSDGSYYTGIATDVRRRLNEHDAGERGAKYLRGRGPLKLVFKSTLGDRSLASRVEYRVKQLSREQKRRLVNGAIELRDVYSGLSTSDA